MNMAPGSTAGTPDVYYETKGSCLWVEYKYVPDWSNKRKLPLSGLSHNQVAWLERAANNGINCALLIGDAQGNCLVLANEQLKDIQALHSTLSVEEAKKQALSTKPKDAALRIQAAQLSK